mmetsp:Transcript_17722/g.14368  ORF Transcript_17722/g.14368 Transcript_17722/m.14368 type:complete len:90 (-) Transcript_17722:122-391(-)
MSKRSGWTLQRQLGLFNDWCGKLEDWQANRFRLRPPANNRPAWELQRSTRGPIRSAIKDLSHIWTQAFARWACETRARASKQPPSCESA